MVALKKKLLGCVAMVAMTALPAVAEAGFFPEIPFCPLGGPPGWFNRLTGSHHSHQPPPPWVWQQQYAWQQPYRPVYAYPQSYQPVIPRQ